MYDYDSDAAHEARTLNAEARMDELDSWAYGVQSKRVPGVGGPLAVHEAYDCRDRGDALDGIERLSGRVNAPEEQEAAWEAFLDRIEAERKHVIDGRDPEEDGSLDLVGPDGLHYWVEAIDRS